MKDEEDHIRAILEQNEQFSCNSHPRRSSKPETINVGGCSQAEFNKIASRNQIHRINELGRQRRSTRREEVRSPTRQMHHQQTRHSDHFVVEMKQQESKKGRQRPSRKSIPQANTDTSYTVLPSSRRPPIVHQLKEARRERRNKTSSCFNDVQYVSANTRISKVPDQKKVSKGKVEDDSISISCDEQYERRKPITRQPYDGVANNSNGNENNKGEKCENGLSTEMQYLLQVHAKCKQKKGASKGFRMRRRTSKAA